MKSYPYIFHYNNTQEKLLHQQIKRTPICFNSAFFKKKSLEAEIWYVYILLGKGVWKSNIKQLIVGKNPVALRVFSNEVILIYSTGIIL